MGNKLSVACEYYRLLYNIDIHVFRVDGGVIIQKIDSDKLNNVQSSDCSLQDGCFVECSNPLDVLEEIQNKGFSSRIIAYRNSWGKLDIPDTGAIASEKLQDF